MKKSQPRNLENAPSTPQPLLWHSSERALVAARIGRKRFPALTAATLAGPAGDTGCPN